jgi:hypothetical protein
MSPLLVARLIGAGRVLVGIALVADPKRVTQGWVGADADREGTQVLARALGVRDFLLGFLALHVAGQPGVGKRTVTAIAVCDVVDGAATVAARKSLPKAGVAGIGALAFGSAIAQVWAGSKLPDA